MPSGIFDFALIVGLAAVMGIIGKLLKQPLILTYILTGLIIGVFGYFELTHYETLKTLADLGIMFLLFLIGLEINYDSLRLVGKSSVIIGLIEMIVTAAIGYVIAIALQYQPIEASYIAIALTFSSTIIVVKLLSEKKDLGSLYGKISVGLLLVQDFAAIFILIALAGAASDPASGAKTILITLAKGIAIFSVIFFIGRRFIPALLNKISSSRELLFLASLAWCFTVASIAIKTGFSVEIGGFLAGIALANSSEHYEIAGRVRSLRDFFILIFFVILGLSLVSFELTGLSISIIVFSLFILIGNPLIVLIIMGLWGYRKRTAFLCGITTAQVSEFSFVLAAMGYKLGHIGAQTTSLITAVGIITIAASSYLIMHNEEIFRKTANFLKIFERKRLRNEIINGDDGRIKPIILIGSHRLGQNILRHLPKKDVLVIDFDPNVIADLKRKGFSTVFGDISDLEIMERSDLAMAKLVISTSPDFEDNNRLLSALKGLKKKPAIILRAEEERDANELYKNGADYVIFPHLSSGQFIGKIIGNHPDLAVLKELRKHDQKLLASG